MSSVKNFFEFRYKYSLQKIVWLFKTKPQQSEDFIFVSQKGSEKWILGAKARRLSKYFEGSSKVIYSAKFKDIPNASGYFFLHQKYYAKALRYNPFLKEKICFVMFTHPEWNRHFSIKHAQYVLQHSSKIVCLNKNMANDLADAGLKKSLLDVWHLASDPSFFPAKKSRKGEIVGFCSAYYDRKNPELIYQLVKKMQHTQFILVGKDWDKFDRFNDMLQQYNFTYYENLAYERYPELYQKMDVFVSPSYLEGGPVPLLEAMLSNVIPVASKTGYCTDIIQHGENGFLFDPTKDSVEHVVSLIEKALLLKGNVRKYVEDYSWKNYGKQISDEYFTYAKRNTN